MKETKICPQCKRELELTLDFFFKKKDTKDGFTRKCKECMGKKFTKKLQAKDGYKFCKKCDRELKIDPAYFPIDLLCVDGYRNVCRECGNDGHFMEEDYFIKRKWSDDENELFTKRYPHYTNEELKDNFYPTETLKTLHDRAYRLSVNKTEETYKRERQVHSERMSGENCLMYGKPMSEVTKRRISIAKKGKYTGIDSPHYGVPKSEEQRRKLSIARKKLGIWKGKNNPRHINPLFGENNGRWEGGITPENKKIRNSNEYTTWRISVFERDNYTCQCCGDSKGGNLHAHHINNFNDNEHLRFDVDNGITLCKDCHDPAVYRSFHYEFGTRNNNIQQLHQYFFGISWDRKSKRIYEDNFKEGAI